MSVFKGYQLQPKYTDEEIKKRRRARELAAAAADTGPDGAAANQPPPSPEPAPNNRMLDARWCDCGQCKEVPKNATLGMCICCQEQDFEGLRDKLDGPNHIVPCITRHEDFKAISLTEAVLQMMEAYTRQQRGYGVREGWTNRLYRLLSYQSYTYWIHGRLGKGNRRIIPACAVNAIRAKWPAPDDMYVSYKDSDEDEMQDAWRL